jgi:uncharacterized MAPEG superfamily protein
MTTELSYLAWSALLTSTLWIPYIVCQVLTNGFLNVGNYKDPTPRPVPLWGQRANRAHINSVESFAPFAALILLIHVAGLGSEMTATWAAIYFYARLLHAIVYMAGIPYVRTLIFSASWIAIVGLFWEVIA